jgi:hypothetical protein
MVSYASAVHMLMHIALQFSQTIIFASAIECTS